MGDGCYIGRGAHSGPGGGKGCEVLGPIRRRSPLGAHATKEKGGLSAWSPIHSHLATWPHKRTFLFNNQALINVSGDGTIPTNSGTSF